MIYLLVYKFVVHAKLLNIG